MMPSGLVWLPQMSQSFNFFSAQSLALLLDTTLKGTIILLLAIASIRALRRASAATRHLVWTLALGALLVLPVASLMMPKVKAPIIPSSLALPSGGQTITSDDFTKYSPNQQNYSSPAPRPAASPEFAMAASSPWLKWILLLWAAGAVLGAARIALGEVRVRRIVRRARLLDASQPNPYRENVRQLLHINRKVEFRTSAEIAIPFTRGAFHPTVLLPAEANQWSQIQLESVLAHELAHVKRYDCLTQLPAQVACALFWFHPLVWLAAFEMRKERERACDDIVLGLGHKATDYADFLLVLSRKLRRMDSAWLTSVALAQSSQMEVRMKALLDPNLNHSPLTLRRVVLAAALAVALILPVAAIRATAQNTLGKVSGTVHDPSGAVVPGATITLVNLETRHSIVGHTGEDGAFKFSAIPAGRYELEITKPGFAPTDSGADLELKPSGDLHQDITLPIGSVTQLVMVQGRKSGEKLPSPPSAPRRIRVGGLVESARVISGVHPDYPASAEKQGIEGTVTLQAVIGTDGHILALSPISGPDPALIKSAMDTIRQWRYSPTLLNGLPVEIATTIQVTFKLDD